MPETGRSLSQVSRIAARGVYELPFIGPQGERYLVAIDRRGRRIMEATLYPWVRDPGAITELLREALDYEDPAHMQLLRS